VFAWINSLALTDLFGIGTLFGQGHHLDGVSINLLSALFQTTFVTLIIYQFDLYLTNFDLGLLPSSVPWEIGEFDGSGHNYMHGFIRNCSSRHGRTAVQSCNAGKLLRQWSSCRSTPPTPLSQKHYKKKSIHQVSIE
jgi:hypothetical protein